MNTQDLRLLKIILEEQAELQPIEGLTPAEVLNKSKHDDFQSIFVFYSEEAQMIVQNYASGRDIPYKLFISADKMIRTTDGLIDEEESMYPYTHYQKFLVTDSPSWMEYLFHQAFLECTLKLFNLFEAFKGRGDLNQLIRSVNFKATANDWMLSVNARNVNDQILFNSPDMAEEITSQIFSVVAASFIAEIGKPMFEGVIREFLNQKRQPEQNIVRKIVNLSV